MDCPTHEWRTAPRRPVKSFVPTVPIFDVWYWCGIEAKNPLISYRYGRRFHGQKHARNPYLTRFCEFLTDA